MIPHARSSGRNPRTCTAQAGGLCVVRPFHDREVADA